MGKRRTLKKKNVLLKLYGVRVLTVVALIGAGWKFNKVFINPPEYATEE